MGAPSAKGYSSRYTYLHRRAILVLVFGHGDKPVGREWPTAVPMFTGKRIILGIRVGSFSQYSEHVRIARVAATIY